MPIDSHMNTAQTDGRIIVLLGLEGLGKTKALLALAGLVPDTTMDSALGALIDARNIVSLCSHQRLWPSRLTVREIMQLAASLYGLDKRDRAIGAACDGSAPTILPIIDDLLRRTGLASSADQSVYTLPHHLARLLGLSLALLPDPDLLLVDDVTQGLSLIAKRRLWQFLVEEQRRRPRTVVFATRDLEAIRALGGETWLIENGRIRQQWISDALPASLFQSAAYRIELKTPLAARRFSHDVTAVPGLAQSCQSIDSTTVQVVVDQSTGLLPLIQMAGRDLADFRMAPLEAEYLLVHWQPDETWQPDIQSTNLVRLSPRARAETEPRSDYRRSPRRSRLRTWQQRRRAIGLIALAELRAHFQRFWKTGNLVFSSIVLVTVLSVLLRVVDTDRFLTWASIALLLPAGMALGFAASSIGRVSTASGAETLFEPAQPFGVEQPMSLLAWYDVTSIGRMGLLSGIALGQLVITLCHTLLFLLLWMLVLVSLNQGIGLMLASLGLLLLTVIDSLALAVVISRFIRRPGWSGWVGWLVGGATLLVIAVRPIVAQPLAWLWPYAGFAVAFERLPDPVAALAPFGLALAGTLLLCTVALRSFMAAPAVWTGHHEE